MVFRRTTYFGNTSHCYSVWIEGFLILSLPCRSVSAMKAFVAKVAETNWVVEEAARYEAAEAEVANVKASRAEAAGLS